jgi:4-hydroxybenzoate polyprenyltransferase
MSTLDLLVVYLRERVRARLLVPLALLLASSGWLLVPQAEFEVLDVLAAAARAFCFTLGFRVWDDLEDRNMDRTRHPNRVMASSTRTAPFLALVALLAVASVVSLLPLTDPLARCIAIAVAVAVLSVWYSTRRSENWNRVAGGHIVLVKYPLIAFAVAPSLPSASGAARTAAVLGGLYALICVYEYVDDPELRQVFFSRRSLP